MLFSPLGVHYAMARLKISSPGSLKSGIIRFWIVVAPYTWHRGM
jgi:hypothetical protein